MRCLTGAFLAIATAIGLASSIHASSYPMTVFADVCLSAYVRDEQADTSELLRLAARPLSSDMEAAGTDYFETKNDMVFVLVNEVQRACSVAIIDAPSREASVLWQEIDAAWKFEHRIEPRFNIRATPQYDGCVLGKSRGVIRLETDRMAYVSILFVGKREQGQITMTAVLTDDEAYYCDFDLREWR